MTLTLVRKLLRDVRLPLLVVALLLAAFQVLWAKITGRITGELLPQLVPKMSLDFIKSIIFSGPGKIVQTLMGGETIALDRVPDMLSIGFVHPLVQVILCVWAIGRSAGAIAGELDRGTMELLLAQPVPRWRVILAHFLVDLVTIPVLCLSIWGGSCLGIWLFGEVSWDAPLTTRDYQVDPRWFGPALWNVAGLLFAVSGVTLWLSAAGRFRGHVMGLAVFLALVQFLINVVGQLWDAVGVLRPFTVFYYYQPQQIILANKWTVDLGQAWNGGQPLWALHVLGVLFTVGAVGYGLAAWTFQRRDLPAPL